MATMFKSAFNPIPEKKQNAYLRLFLRGGNIEQELQDMFLGGLLRKL